MGSLDKNQSDNLMESLLCFGAASSNNVTDSDPDGSGGLQITSLLGSRPDFGIPFLFFGLLAVLIGVIGNVVILMVFLLFYIRDVHKIGGEFIINLATVDFLISTIVIPFAILGKLLLFHLQY